MIFIETVDGQELHAFDRQFMMTDFIDMKNHEDIDRRSFEMASRIVERIDEDPDRNGLQNARLVCKRWYDSNPQPAIAKWMQLLERDWQDIRAVLLDESERGREMRQNSPFCGILSSEERWEVYREFRDHEKRPA